VALEKEGDSLVGTTLAGKYRIDARLNEGGMGTVYRSLSFRMRFTFQAGRVISAGGWQRSIVIGNLAAPEAQE
jgi:hypothetical protein